MELTYARVKYVHYIEIVCCLYIIHRCYVYTGKVCTTYNSQVMYCCIRDHIVCKGCMVGDLT